MPQSSQTPEKRGRGPSGQTPAQIILRMTDRSGECWVWTGRKNPKGYAQIVIAKHQRTAHRVSYETFIGPIPEGLEIDHLCRVRHCVNPAHLEPVTHQENVRRAIAATGMVGGKPAGGMRLGETCRAGHVVDAGNSYLRRGLIRCLTCRREQNRLSAARARLASSAEASSVKEYVDRDGDAWVPDGIDDATRETRLVCPKPQAPEDAGDGPSYPWTLSEVQSAFGPLKAVTA
ncbi:HNH endonuclease [Streptomyces sp. ND04-05B]|uniref:HNH endonuclease n=1 Tax=Streptomyces sp. ND04-05B TaxID=3028693 RepID=UPI0029ABAB1F|nr:HNH endonuclease [Streptomyces sp. ND04-05B]MDX3067722.1 HNH endonuclease [Streptomyces sp. ND04-05B]